MRLMYITPCELHWRARKKLPSIDKLLEQACQYLGRKIDYYLDSDHYMIIDVDKRHVMVYGDVTFNLESLWWSMAAVRDYAYYEKNLEHIINTPSIFNRYLLLKQRYYG